MDPAQFGIGVVIALAVGICIGLGARSRMILRCLTCQAILPQQCADQRACADRRDGIRDLQASDRAESRR